MRLGFIKTGFTISMEDEDDDEGGEILVVGLGGRGGRKFEISDGIWRGGGGGARFGCDGYLKRVETCSLFPTFGVSSIFPMLVDEEGVFGLMASLSIIDVCSLTVGDVIGKGGNGLSKNSSSVESPLSTASLTSIKTNGALLLPPIVVEVEGCSCFARNFSILSSRFR